MPGVLGIFAPGEVAAIPRGNRIWWNPRPSSASSSDNKANTANTIRVGALNFMAPILSRERGR